MTGFSRTFNNIFGGGDTHPALAAPAGLSSSQNARAQDRGACVTDARDYGSVNSPTRVHKQAALALPSQVYANMSSADIQGARPSARPILATKDALNFHTNRFTSPLEPRYTLPRIHSPTSSGGGAGSPSSPASPSKLNDHRFDVSDIEGTRPRPRNIARPTGHRDTLDVADINTSRSRPAARTPGCLTTTDIEGAAPLVRHPAIPSPGKGTLRCDDIEGSGPGNFRHQYAPMAYSSTTHAGRWPLTASTTPGFASSPRKTVLAKPLMTVD